MKLWFTDSKGQKRLIAEGKNLNEILQAADAHARSHFIFLNRLELVSSNPHIFVFKTKEDKDSGYSVEE